MSNWAAVARWNVYSLWHTRLERKLPYWPERRLEKLQARRIQAMVAFAYRRVPFYHETMDALGLSPADFSSARDLAKLPIVDKAEVMNAPQLYSPSGAGRGERVLIVSSGTSGRPTSIHYTPEALFRALAHGQRQRHVLKNFVGRNGGYRETVIVRLNSVQQQLREYYEAHSWAPKNLELERQIVIMDESNFDEQVSRINDFSPDVIRGYGSYLGAFFRRALERKLQVKPPSAVVYGADRMSGADRELIESGFGIPVLSTYQAVEALRIGYECELRRGFHVFVDDVAVRIVDDDSKDVEQGGQGQILISNLTNRGTVLLNYRLGDIVTVSHRSCPCGRTLPLIESIEGRADDLIVLPSGDPMHGLALLGRLNQVPGVAGVQLVQETTTRFTINTVVAPGADKRGVETALVKATHASVGRVSIVLNWVDDLPRGPGGKVKAVVSRCTA